MTSDPTLHKADFDSIYDRPDPRAYYSTLAPLEYRIPQDGADVATRLLRARRTHAPATVLDVCCSYGVLAMLLKTGLGLGELAQHYADPARSTLTSDEVADSDRRLLDTRRQPMQASRGDAPRVVGLDVATRAVEYAVSTGALDAGAAEDLENASPSARLRDLLGEVDLVVTTGGVGYVTERTFEAILASTPPGTWFATFCLRTYDVTPVLETMGRHGLRTETADAVFRQRRFTGADEQSWAVAEARSLGFDTTGLEEGGSFYAQLYLSRPDEDVARSPLSALLGD